MLNDPPLRRSLNNMATKPKPAAKPAPTQAKSNVQFDLLEDNTITRQEGTLAPVTVATLNGKQIEYADEDARKLYGPAVVQFLTDENIPFDTDQITVAGTEGADLVADENSDEFNASIPKPPRQNIRQGDKTPAYVEWLQKYKPNTFKQKYGIIGRGKIRTEVRSPDPLTGRERISYVEEEALLSRRKTHLTSLPQSSALIEDQV